MRQSLRPVARFDGKTLSNTDSDGMGLPCFGLCRLCSMEQSSILFHDHMNSKYARNNRIGCVHGEEGRALVPWHPRMGGQYSQDWHHCCTDKTAIYCCRDSYPFLSHTKSIHCNEEEWQLGQDFRPNQGYKPHLSGWAHLHSEPSLLMQCMGGLRSSHGSYQWIFIVIDKVLQCPPGKRWKHLGWEEGLTVNQQGCGNMNGKEYNVEPSRNLIHAINTFTRNNTVRNAYAARRWDRRL